LDGCVRLARILEPESESRRLSESPGCTFDIADRFSALQDGDGRSFQGGDPMGNQSGVREQTTAGPRERRDGIHDVEIGLSDRRGLPQRTSSDVLHCRHGRQGLGFWRGGLAGHVGPLLVLLVEGTIPNERAATDSCVLSRGGGLVRRNACRQASRVVLEEQGTKAFSSSAPRLLIGSK
jgi:hypothetical protein